MARISGPLLDRIDIQIEVPTVPLDALQTQEPSGDAFRAGGPVTSLYMRMVRM